MIKWTAAPLAAAALSGLALSAALPASAASAPAPERAKSCFYTRNLSSWTAVDRTTVNLRVGVSDYYQLKLMFDCPNLDWAQHIGLEHRGSDWICSGLDAELIVPQGAGAAALRCPVVTIRKLSPEEASALPPKYRP